MRLPFLLLLAVSSSLAAAAEFRLEAGTPLPVPDGLSPTGVTTGDFDGDGRRDVAVLTYSQELLLYLQQAGGGFAAPTRHALGFDAGTYPYLFIRGIAVADVNGDRRDDILLNADEGYRLLLSVAAGGWQLRRPAPTGRLAGSPPVMVDIDRDGDVDLLQVEHIESYPPRNGYVRSAIHVYAGDGSGGFAQRGLIDAEAAIFSALAIGHFDDDAFVDLAALETENLMHSTLGNVTVRYGRGGGAFSPRVRLDERAGKGLAVGDFDGDGDDDLVTGGFGSGSDGTARMQLRQSRGTGGFAPPTPLPSSGDVLSMRAGDPDDDGDADLLAVFEYGSQMLSYVQRAGQLGLPEATTLTAPYRGSPGDNSESNLLAVADMNADGRDDAIAIVGDLPVVLFARIVAPTGTLPATPAIAAVDFPDGATTARLTINRPAGSVPVTGYRLETSPVGPPVPRTEVAAGTAPFQMSLTGLDLDRPYTVRVRAYNAAGDGPLSAPVTVTRVLERRLSVDEYIHIPEGDGVSVYPLVVRLNRPAGPGGVRFDIRSDTFGTGDTAARPDIDYRPVDRRDVLIPEGATSTTVDVTILGDDAIGFQLRQFQMTVSNIRGALDQRFTRTLTIDDDETRVGLPQMWIYGGTIVEGDSGVTELPFEVHLDRAPAVDVVYNVYWEPTLDLPNAFPPDDFTTREVLGLRIPAGATTGSFTIPFRGDTTPENHEFYGFYFTIDAGAQHGSSSSSPGMILDDDRIEPPLYARADRVILSQNRPGVIPHLANDRIENNRYGRLIAGINEDLGRFWGHDNGTPNSPNDDYLVFAPKPGLVDEVRKPYRLCEYFPLSIRCVDAYVDYIIRPIPEADVQLRVDRDAGFRDIEIAGLAAMPSARFETTALVAPEVVEQILAGDAHAETPWDDLAGTHVTARMLPIPADGQPRQWRVLVDAFAQQAGDIDLYVGLDSDGDGQADPGELACTSAMQPQLESCELDLAQPGNAAVGYWVLQHNRGAAPLAARVEISAVRLGSDDGSLRATGPGHLEAGDFFRLRLGWNSPGMLPGDRRVGYLRVSPAADDAGGLVPIRIDYDGETWDPAPVALRNGIPHALRVPGQRSHRRLFIDVPRGATALAVQTQSAADVDLFLLRADAPGGPTIAPAPARSLATARSQHAGGNESLLVEGAALQPGRWYVDVPNNGTGVAAVTITAAITGTAPVVRSGSYFNAARGGHGMFLYPAGNQWAGLWYTYFQDGTPTWLYLQGVAPGADGIWRGGIYRAAWNGGKNKLTQVGEATATPTAADAFSFTYSIDGETGSEPMQSLGRGCPTVGGKALDLSSNWFNPARAGTGYSVQLWPTYEMYIAFVYDAQGVPRFLTAENTRFGGASAVLKLEQLEGFCPLCARTGNPLRRDVGTFLREIDAEGRLHVGIDAIYENGLPGFWTGDEAVLPLGGAGTTQGCMP